MSISTKQTRVKQPGISNIDYRGRFQHLYVRVLQRLNIRTLDQSKVVTFFFYQSYLKDIFLPCIHVLGVSFLTGNDILSALLGVLFECNLSTKPNPVFSQPVLPVCLSRHNLSCQQSWPTQRTKTGLEWEKILQGLGLVQASATKCWP